VSAEAAAPEALSRTVDGFLGGLVTLVQPERGHRAGLDAALLQALVPADAAGQAVDLGAGVGTVAFCVAVRAPALAVIGVERDPELLACARAALQMPENADFAGRVTMVEADIVAMRRALPERSAAWVLMNPPYDTAGRVRQSPDPRRRAAHLGGAGLLAEWCRTAAALLKPGGHLALIHRAAALPAVLAALSGRFGGVRLMPVHPGEGAPATRILVRARRASRVPLELAPGIILHQDGGAWTRQADAILRGDADLSA
jgi:tRNA1(Val) A37 N6-methylase TrmN6